MMQEESMAGRKKASVQASDIPEEQAIFNYAWQLIKEYANISQDDDDEEWLALANSSAELFIMGKQRATRELSSGFAMSILRYIEIKSKRRD